MHGLVDGNVHPAHDLRLSAALLAAGRPHEVLLLPGVGHQSMSTPGVTENLLRHQARFPQCHLMACPLATDDSPPDQPDG
jgi:dipeptidyl-peptidase-4